MMIGLPIRDRTPQARPFARKSLDGLYGATTGRCRTTNGTPIGETEARPACWLVCLLAVSLAADHVLVPSAGISEDRPLTDLQIVRLA
jgi:hypothetical protein